MEFVLFLVAMASAIFMLWCISVPPMHAHIGEASRSLEVQQASAGISFIILEVLLAAGQSSPPSVVTAANSSLVSVFIALPRSLLSRSFKRDIYHCTHISYMRIGHTRSLIQQHGIPPPMFFFLRLDIPSLFWLRHSSHSHSVFAFTSTPSFSHINSPFIPVRLTGGGNVRKPFAPDTKMVDALSTEELTSNHLLFDSDEWIGRGKIWSETLHLQSVAFDLEVPRQRDGFSCGIIVLDLMATILLQHSIRNPQNAAVRRMEWFLRLSADFSALSEVRLDFYW